jgi:hypothetical protein
MTNFSRNFVAGRMNKTFDERVVPEGDYIDAMNIRMGSTEKSEAGVIENTNGNLPLTALEYGGTELSSFARCIGAIEDSARETIYWFVHDPKFTSVTGKLDLIVSFNVVTQVIIYHIISVDNGGGVDTTLNFNEQYLITGVNLIEDLLYWTDDYNPPRFINIKTGYANPDGAGIDYNGQPDLLYETIQVIKKPPTAAPTLSLVELSDESNFLEDRFICFAYRYRYADSQYSATSQWTEPAFLPKDFQFSASSYLNEGMENKFNGVDVSFNTGGPLVIGIDLLFKEATGNIIKVIEKFNKQDSGWLDNTTQTYLFSNSKIYTILPESELLRLYDNVPRFAKAQTIMGNRLMYGNYVDGYDLIDANGYPTNFDYTTQLISTEIGTDEVVFSYSVGLLPFAAGFWCTPPCLIPDNILNIDLSGMILKNGYLLSIDITLDDFSLSPDDVVCNFSFTLPVNYTSVYQMASSAEFQNAIGTVFNIKPVYNPIPGGDTSCDGYTFTDIFNCNTPPFFLSLGRYESGITAGGQPIALTTSPGSDIITLQFPAMRYVDNPTAITSEAFLVYRIKSCNVRFEEFVSQKSLHSDRDYEIGIVYMDEYLRSTPANVSQFNNVHVPCSFSAYSNTITVTIPPSQVAPYWAKFYKFVCKADQHRYETIYSNIFFLDPDTQQTYFLLQGENARKVEEGDRLIVKADSDGPVQQCTYATVLEKEAKPSGFITLTPSPPSGVYMKIKADNFTSNNDPLAVIDPGTSTATSSTTGQSPILAYSMNVPNPLSPGNFIDYTVPAGSIIVFDIKFIREGFGDNPCETRRYLFEKTYVSSSNYANMYDWFIQDNVDTTLNSGIQNVGAGQCPVNNIFISSLGGITTGALCDNYWRFYRNPITQHLQLYMSGTWACGASNKRKSKIIANIKVFRAIENIIFETEPTDTLPDVFFENELSFEIDANGNHLSGGAPGDQSQDISLGIPGIIQTGFFNCFAFGNGAESYKIRDSLVGRDFNLGNRVTTVAAQDYKESRRFADITYSGVYNPETNVNKLNEFNYALLNYKNLELSFGAVYILDGRETDVLVLQEDRVSYVLAGKNLLSDAAAGGAITSVPEVLGTQIARTEKYGISFNPESYVQWGYDRFFTDAKRGAVLQLKGNSYSNEQIVVISEQNMRTWFRDEFIETFNTQKLGGFDPYMNEYVLTMNDRKLPQKIECSKCGITQTFTFAQGEEITSTTDYCVNLGLAIGDVVVEWNVISIDPTSEFEVTATYDAVTYPSGIQTSAGSLSFFKNTQSPNNVDIALKVKGNAVISMTVRCPEEEPMTLVEVVWTNNSDAGLATLKQFNYVNGTYTSPLQSNFFIFASGTGNPLVSYYLVTNGFEGQGPIPVAGSTMTLRINETFPWATFVFDPLSDKFRYARTSVLYGNNDIDMQALLAVSTIATPITTPLPSVYAADFIVPPSASGQYLYIIWDLRQSYNAQLCYGETIEEVCCECIPCEEECSRYMFTNPSTATENAVIFLPFGTCFVPEGIIQVIEPNESFSFCLPNVKDNYIIDQGNPIIYMESCECPVEPIDPDAEAFILAAGIEDPTQQDAIEGLVSDLKTYGLWAKLTAIYPFVGGIAFSHKFNLKDPQDTDAAYRLVFFGGWTHDANGITGNGTNTYANTKLNPASHLILNSTHMSIYCRTNNSGNYLEMGVYDGFYFNTLYANESNLFSIRLNSDSVSQTVSNTNSQGNFIASRTTANDIFSKINNNAVNNFTKLTQGRPNGEVYIGNFNFTGAPFGGYYSNRNYAFSTFGDGLSAIEASDLYIAIQNFNTILGRQVI